MADSAVVVPMFEVAGVMVPWHTEVARYHWTDLVVGWEIRTHGVLVEVVAHPATDDSRNPSYWRVVGPCLLSIGGAGYCDCRPRGWVRSEETPWCRQADNVRSSHHVAMVETVAVNDQTESSGLWPFVKAAGDSWHLQIRADIAEAVQRANGEIYA